MYKSGDKFKVTVKVKKVLYKSESSFFRIFSGEVVSSQHVQCLNESNDTEENKYSPALSAEETFHVDYPTIEVGDTFDVDVTAEHRNPNYPPSLKVNGLPTLVLPTVEIELFKFLEKRLKKVGKVTIQKMFDLFGLDCISRTINEPDRLVEEGVNKARVNAIVEQLEELVVFNHLSSFLYPVGVSIATSQKIFEMFGTEGLRVVQSDPYSILKNEEIQFKDADRIARFLSMDAKDRNRLSWGVQRLVRLREVAYGDLGTPISELITGLAPILNTAGEHESIILSEDEIKDAIDQSCKEGHTEKRIAEGREVHIYSTDLATTEKTIIKSVVGFLKDFRPPILSQSELDSFFMDIENESTENQHSEKFVPAKQQKDAVYMGLLENLSILTGGPGTGKTATVNLIVEAYESLTGESDVCLLAPTGKAAKRLTQLTNKPATTIHRKLNLSGYGSGEGLEKITDKLVIIDEFSMVDAPLAMSLLNNVSDETHVILVGDVNQLPSVGPGLILREFIDSKKIPTTMLTEVFRQSQDSQIIKNSYLLNNGETNIHFDHSKKDMYFLDTQSVTHTVETIKASVKKLVFTQKKKIDDIIILSPMKVGPLGTIELNKMIQSLVNPPSSSKKEINKNAESKQLFREGDRVIHLENDSEKGIANGETGVVERIYWDVVELESGIKQSTEMMDVIYKDPIEGERIVSYTSKELKTVELSYALSIHKSQGSEYPIVIVPFSVIHKRMLYRNLFYTAWTRTRETCINIGSKEALNFAIQNTGNTKRNSLLIPKLSEALSETLN